jgi:hypothetical protein
MNLFTEKEYVDQNSHFTFRLRNLYRKNEKEFYQIQEYLPSPVYINDRVTLKHHFFSESFLSKGKEIENFLLLGLGKSYLKKISNLTLFKQAEHTAKEFHLENDYNCVCNYLQCISINKKMTPYFTNKILIDEKLTLNISMFPSDSELLGKIYFGFAVVAGFYGLISIVLLFTHKLFIQKTKNRIISQLLN